MRLRAFTVCSNCQTRNYFYEEVKVEQTKPQLLYRCSVKCRKCGNAYDEIKSIGAPLMPEIDIGNIVGKVFDEMEKRGDKFDPDKFRVR